MDTASVESDIPDLIQCLRFPPVVKLDHGEFGEYEKKHIEVLHHRKISNFNDSDYETRELFSFPKTNVIQEDLSFLTITGLLPRTVHRPNTGFRTKNTPIIGASIIHNCKTRSRPVKVHTTINADKVVNNEKLYLVIRGSEQNKVYELRSIENPLLTNDSKVQLLKDFVQHNRMDKKKKKSADKKNKDKKKKNKSSDEPEDENHSDREACQCPKEPIKTRSQIKIYGRIGLTNDDNYVMDCEASVSDEPIETRYDSSEFVSNSSSNLFQKDDVYVYRVANSNKYYQSGSGQSSENMTKYNSFAQTGSYNNSPRIVSPSDSGKEDDVSVSKESQSTQTQNFNICVKNNNGSWSISPKCGCGKVRNDKDDCQQQITINSCSDKVSEDPIVVISVYPKKAVIENKNTTNNETMNNIAIRTKSRQKSVSPISTSTSFEKAVRKENKRTSINEKDVKNKKNQRGTSPKKNKNTNTENDKSERATTKTTQRRRSVSPNPSDKQVEDKSKKINKSIDTKQSTKTKSVQTEMKRESSPKKGNAKIIKTKSVHKETTIESVSKRDAIQQKNSNSNTVKQTSKAKKNQISTNSENNKTVTKSANNDKEENSQQKERSVTQTAIERPKSALRTILDNVLKQPKEGASNITINIDAENEFYNVFLRHNPQITDLKLKKVCLCPPDARTVLSDNDGEICFNTESTSMTNLLLQPESDSNRKRAKSQTTITTESNEKENSSRKLSFTKARDSLEISHMRDDLKQSRSFVQEQDSSKHFTGDQCSLIDPMERDKEVRQLLGVNNAHSPRTTETSETTDYDSKRRNGGDGDIGDFLSLGNKIQIFKVMKDSVVPINTYKCVKCEPTNNDRKYNKRSAIERSSLYKQIMLVDESELLRKRNRYIDRKHVINLTRANEKPIVLTKPQYEKVKKAIKIQILKAASSKKCVFKRTSFVSIIDTSKRGHKKRTTMHKSTQTFGLQYNKGDVKYSNERVIQATDYQIQDHNESSSITSIVRIDNTNVCKDNDTSFEDADLPYSIKTIFQYKAAPRKRKSLTPNLGPSLSSLYADNISLQNKPGSSSMKYILPSQQKKKPFLRRLMSCLVMRAKASRMKMKFGFPLSSENTDTSYHISTTLAPMEMTSSLFDTSVSFYSNHAIVPITYKMKKSFLNSMKGLLKKN